jgi:hypothetical protein
MLMLLSFAGAVALARGAWVVARLVRALPRENADFVWKE